MYIKTNIVQEFCTIRKNFFKIRKCNDLSCSFHKPIRGDDEINSFPDLVPLESDGVLHYKPGGEVDEKYLPSKLEDTEKISHNIPFSPSGQTAKNVSQGCCILNTN